MGDLQPHGEVDGGTAGPVGRVAAVRRDLEGTAWPPEADAVDEADPVATGPAGVLAGGAHHQLQAPDPGGHGPRVAAQDHVDADAVAVGEAGPGAGDAEEGAVGDAEAAG